MAWPLTPLQTFVTKVTRISAAFLNDLQSPITALFSGVGNGTLAKLVVDAVGAQAISLTAGTIAKFTGGLVEMNGATGDGTAALKFTGTITTRKPFGDFLLG